MLVDDKTVTLTYTSYACRISPVILILEEIKIMAKYLMMLHTDDDDAILCDFLTMMSNCKGHIELLKRYV